MTTSPLTPTQFRINMPEFASTEYYADAVVQQWLTVGYEFVNPHAWHDNTDFGASLVAAHFLSLARRDQIASEKGGAPGTQTGAMTSKAVGGASISYDVALTAVQGAGAWNATRYGQTYATLSKLYGAGAFVF